MRWSAGTAFQRAHRTRRHWSERRDAGEKSNDEHHRERKLRSVDGFESL
jgi:hypothetical protein